MKTKNGNIIIIDDDLDDQLILENVFKELWVENPLIFFKDSVKAYQYLLNTDEQPFLILCDINMPRMSGLELKNKIDQHPRLKEKSIPFVFLSTSCRKQEVMQAYNQLTVQGFLKKSYDMDQLKEKMKIVLQYWSICEHPNS